MVSYENLDDAISWLNHKTRFFQYSHLISFEESESVWRCSFDHESTKWLFQIKEHEDIVLQFKLMWA